VGAFSDREKKTRTGWEKSGKKKCFLQYLGQGKPYRWDRKGALGRDF